MPIYSKSDYGYWQQQLLHRGWHRNDFITHLYHEATGGPSIGAIGDRVTGQANWQWPFSIMQLTQTVRNSRFGTTRIQGVQVATTPPTNGQVLVFDTSTNQYVPTTLPVPGSSNCILAGNMAYVNGSQPSFTLGIGGVLDVALSGSSGGVEGTIGSNNAEIAMPYAGTAKNMTMNAAVNGPAHTTYTLTLYSTAHGNTPVTSSVTVAATGFTLVTFTDTTHTYDFAAFEQGFYKITHNASSSVTVLLQGYSLEYDHA